VNAFPAEYFFGGCFGELLTTYGRRALSHNGRRKPSDFIFDKVSVS